MICKSEIRNSKSEIFLRFVLTITFIALLSYSYAGDIDKAFKYLNTGDYPNANKYLREVLAEEPDNAAANYGMAKYFSFKDNPVYNLDSANFFIKKASAKLPSFRSRASIRFRAL